jgi:hypothetical protein
MGASIGDLFLFYLPNCPLNDFVMVVRIDQHSAEIRGRLFASPALYGV